MRISTSRFGELSVDKKDLLNFKEGILGFENLTKFFVVDPGDSTLILWLQAVDEPSVAFPIIEPKIFSPDYIVKLLPAELTSLDLENVNDASIYVILTIPEDVTKMNANLKAPIVINNKKNTARQIVLQDNKLSVNFEMYKELKSNIVNYSSDDTRRSRIQISTSEETSTETTKTISEESTSLGKEEPLA